MRYAGIIRNDIAAAPGICLSFFTQGCPHRCKGCHNPETWDYNGGREFTAETLASIISGLTANEIERSLCIMGGEPMCEENLFLVNMIINEVKNTLPQVKIFLWTGYIYEELKKRTDPYTKSILSSIDCIIDGPYEEDKRDISLFMRGSTNQRIIYLK